MSRVARRVLTLALLPGLLALPLSGVAKPENGQVFDDWRAACGTVGEGAEEACHVFQNLVVTETQRQLMHVMVLTTPRRNVPVMIVTLPLGVSLPPGAQLSVDGGSSKQLTFETCTQTGCRAGLILDAETLASMQRGLKATVAFKDMRGQALSLPLSLKGFTRAVGSLD